MQQPEADRLLQAATAALAQGHAQQAAELLDQAIQRDPNHPMVLTKQAELAILRKDPDRALALTAAALAAEPHCAPAWHQRAAACWLAGHQQQAVQAARTAVDIQPPNPEFRLRLAQFAAWTGDGVDIRETLSPLLEARQHDPAHYAAALSMLGEQAIARGRFGAANACLDQALDLMPDLHVTRMMRGMNLLRLGQFRQGWADYAARQAIFALNPDGPQTLADQVWRGQPLAGKTLVVFDDQGHGDAIQFFRYLPMLRDLGPAQITWRTFPALARLLTDAAPYATVCSTLPRNQRFDFQCDSTSLPRWFATELNSIPAKIPYLWPPPKAKSNARIRQPRVGLAWSGDKRHPRDHLRSIPAQLFLTLADTPGISFHSLQHEVRATDLPALQARPRIARNVEQATDLADTATLIASLDLVITVDTAVAHLAAALGKPVWIVLHMAPDWRWLTGRKTTPWYPAVRLFRVTRPEWLPPLRSARPIQDAASFEPAWHPVLNRVSHALRTFAAHWRPPQSRRQV